MFKYHFLFTIKCHATKLRYCSIPHLVHQHMDFQMIDQVSTCMGVLDIVTHFCIIVISLENKTRDFTLSKNILILQQCPNTYSDSQTEDATSSCSNNDTHPSIVCPDMVSISLLMSNLVKSRVVLSLLACFSS